MSESNPTPERPDGAPDWDAIARHLAGESSAAESAAVGAWLSAHPEDARAFDLLEGAAARMRRSAVHGVDIEAALARVHERMREPAVKEAPVIPLRSAERSVRRRYMPYLAAAAAVIVMAVGAVRLHREPSLDAARTFATVTGKVHDLRLSDGTHVVLGPSSQLIVREGYGEGRRDVELHGTALFEVRHDAARPFSVRTDGAVLTDIGTAFTVRADSAEGVEVSVSEGAVRMQADGGAAVELAAGDLATLPPSGTMVVQRAGATPDDAAWTRGRLVFREAPVARVRSELRRWFGVELVTADSTLASRHLTASFANDSRQQVLDVIALALGATCEWKGDTAVLRPASLTARPRK